MFCTGEMCLARLGLGALREAHQRTLLIAPLPLPSIFIWRPTEKYRVWFSFGGSCAAHSQVLLPETCSFFGGKMGLLQRTRG